MRSWWLDPLGLLWIAVINQCGDASKETTHIQTTGGYSCPEGSTLDEDRCIKYTDEKVTWFEAERFCQQKFNGELVDYSTWPEGPEKTIPEFWANGFKIYSINGYVWKFRGESFMNYFNWRSSGPSFGPNDNYLHMDESGKWHDEDVSGSSLFWIFTRSQAYRFICQNATQKLSNHYDIKVDNQTYTVFLDFKTYSDAESYCRARAGGYLAEIKDTYTQEAIYSKLTPKQNYWIGGRKVRDSAIPAAGEFKWISSRKKVDGVTGSGNGLSVTGTSAASHRFVAKFELSKLYGLCVKPATYDRNQGTQNTIPTSTAPTTSTKPGAICPQGQDIMLKLLIPKDRKSAVFHPTGSDTQLSLSAGVHRVNMSVNDVKCQYSVRVYDSNPAARLVCLETSYKVNCTGLDETSYSIIDGQLLFHHLHLQKLCSECKLKSGMNLPLLTCENDILKAVWSTTIEFKSMNPSMSENLQHTLRSALLQSQQTQINSTGSFLQITVSSNNPPVASPMLDSDGLLVRPVVLTTCNKEMVYNAIKDACEILQS